MFYLLSEHNPVIMRKNMFLPPYVRRRTGPMDRSSSIIGEL